MRRLTLSLTLYLVSCTLLAGELAPNVDKDGNISLPTDFRRTMVHLGSWFVPAGAASGFHDVYLDAASVDTYRQTGQFPDGATLVKELRPHAAATYSTGADVAHAEDDIKQWFVMVKDGSGRFANNPLWGNGWGWALFLGQDPGTNAATDYRKDCLGCHVPARATDHVYIEAYPTLRSSP